MPLILKYFAESSAILGECHRKDRESPALPNLPFKSPPAFFIISSGFSAFVLVLPASRSVSLFHGLYSHPVPSPSSPSSAPVSPFFRFLEDFSALAFSFAFFSARALALASLLSF